MLLIAAKTNTNSCQAWILVNFTNVAPAHSSIQYRQILEYHLIEETHSYPHVWKFPENILKYLYGGTFKKCKLFLRHTVYQNKLVFNRLSWLQYSLQTRLGLVWTHSVWIPGTLHTCDLFPSASWNVFASLFDENSLSLISVVLLHWYRCTCIALSVFLFAR